MRPKMADVAKLAGVSISTVSLVLNEKPGISSEVRAAVRQAVEELGYIGRVRRSEEDAPTTKNVTLVHYASPDSDYLFERSGLFLDYAASIQEYFQNQNVNWTLISNYKEDDPGNLSFQLLNADVTDDGFILMGIPSPDSSFLQQMITNRKPIVILSRDWPLLPVSTVSQDYRQQAQIALEHLVALGHRQIAFLARDIDREFDWFDIRLDCYREVMGKLETAVSNRLIAVDKTGAAAATTLMKDHPEVTAIFAIHDENAVSAIEGLQKMGYRVPEDISVIGLDDSAEMPQGYPGITTVTFPHRKAAQLAAETLLRQLEDESVLYSKIFINSCLIERDSCTKPKDASSND